MFPVTLTAYGQSLISDIVNIDKIVLVYETVNIESVSSLAPYLPALFEEEACGNFKNNIGNVYIRDLRDDSTSYQANTILFCKYDGSELKPVAGYSQDTPIVKKSDNQILSVYLSFDFSVFTNGFLFASIQAGYSTAAHNTDGLLHLEDPNIESDDTYSVYSKPQADALLQAKQPLLTAGDGISLAGNVARTTGIPFGICDDTSSATKFTVTVPGIYKLEDGVCCLVKNGVITSASGFTLNVNGLGAKPVYSNMAAATRETTIFNVAYTMLFVYDSTRVEGGCWVCYRGYYTSSNSIGYQLRTSTSTLPVKFTTYRYRLYFLSPDHTHFIGANESTSINATSEREPTSEKIDPFGRIVYYSTNGTTNAGSNLAATAIWDQYTITLGYSFGPFTLTANRPVYLRCTPQDDGSAIIDASNTIMQTLPEFADGKIYIFLGVADSTTQIELYINHPVYYHDGTGIRIWPGKAIPSKTSDLTNDSGFIASADIPSDISAFNNDVGYITTETDPTVPSWAKQINKPSYNLDEVTDGSTRKLSNYVPTSRKVNGNALTSDIVLDLDDIGDGTNRKIPTNVSELTNDSGYLTSYTETDPTVPSWAKQPTKPTYTASEVGALPDTTVIPSKTSDLTNDSGFITSSDIPTNVSEFNNDAGYLTSFTETDPTVPSWAKEQNKPSYTLDEVSDGATRKLSNYVPTSRKINNKALSSDITLNLDDVLDGSTRKLNNYIPYSEVISTINGFDNRRLWQYEIHNTLWAANKRYDVTLTGFSNNNASASLFDGSFETNVVVPKSGTGVILISGKNGSKMWSGGYPYGYLEVAFYYTSVPESVTCRVYSDWAQNPGWHSITLTNVCKNSNQALYRGVNTGFYGVTQMEITINAKDTVTANVTEVAFYQTRGTLQQMAVFNKTVAQTLYHDLTAPRFRTTDGTSAQFVKGDGSLDSSTYITSASLPTKVSQLTNDVGYITDEDLPDFELKANLKGGAYKDVNTSITSSTKTSTNLATVNAITSYIEPLIPTKTSDITNDSGFITSASIPTNVSAFTNDAGYLTQHQSLAGVVATAQYNSTNKTIEFYNHSGTKLNTDIDATPFIKDGMINTVEITGGNLVITFNTDSGKENIVIPLTDIFDASNYYTKTETNTQISSAISDLNLGTASTKNYSTDMNTDANLPTTSAIKSYISNQGFALATDIPENVSDLTNDAGYITSASLSDYVQKVTSTDNAIVRFSGTDGTIQNSKVIIDDAANLILPIATSSTFANNAKLVLGNAWFGSNPSGGLAYGTRSGSTYTGKYTFEATTFRPVSGLDNSIDIGTSSYRWKNLYIAGKICKDGTYQITVPSKSGTMALTSDIPTAVSAFTNDAGYITDADLPTNVSEFTNDAGYLTSYTETDPTVPSWAKQSSKPSYTLDEVTDGTTRKLSNYVPTSRKVNNKALTSDITLTLDEVSDGSTRKLSNYVPTSRKINNKALTSDITLTLDNISDGTTRKIPTDTADLTNGAGFITSYTETDPTVPNWAKQQNKPSYNLDEVIDGTNRKLPTRVSDLNNDAGYITGYTETDPTVPSWAKSPTKPSYTASEVGALPDTTVIPSKTSELTNDSGFITSAAVPNKTTARGDGGYLYNGQNVDTMMSNFGISSTTNLLNNNAYVAIRAKSDNPFFGLKEGSNLWYAQAASNYFYFGPTSTKALRLDQSGNGVFQTGTCTAKGFKYQNGSTAGTSSQVLIANGTVNTLKTVNNESLLGTGNITVAGDTNIIESISVDGVAQTVTDKNVDLHIPNDITCAEFTGSLYRNNVSGSGAISKTGITGEFPTIAVGGEYVVKTKMASATATYTLDVTFGSNSYSLTSSSGVIEDTRTLTLANNSTWNGVLATAVAANTIISIRVYKVDSIVTTVGSVAVSSNYYDLDNLPTIPTKTSDITNDSGFITSSSLAPYELKSNLKEGAYVNVDETIMTSTSTNLPSSKAVATYISNQGFAKTSQIPNSTSDLTNDSGFITSADIPTNVSDLTNDAGYITSSDLPTNHVTTDTAQEIFGTKTIAESKLKIGSTSSSEDIDNFVFKRGQEFIVGTQTSSTSLWKGNTTQDSIYEGMCVNYFVPVACTSTAITLELTLPDGTTTGAIPVRRNAGSTATSTHIGVGSVVQLTLLLNRTVGSTSYEKVWRMNEWYDSNTNTVGYQLRTNSTVMNVSDTARYYKLYFTSANGNLWVPASVNSTNDATTARAVNQRPINPFGRIVYTSASTSYATGANLAATTIWDQYNLSLGYSFNVSGGTLSLTAEKPVYVKCAPQADGSAIIDATNPTVQDLPSSNDGKIYIFLGAATSATAVELFQNHPVYYHDGNGIKLWSGSVIPTTTSQLTNNSGFITAADLSDFVTTNTEQEISANKLFSTGLSTFSSNKISYDTSSDSLTLASFTTGASSASPRYSTVVSINKQDFTVTSSYAANGHALIKKTQLISATSDGVTVNPNLNFGDSSTYSLSATTVTDTYTSILNNTIEISGNSLILYNDYTDETTYTATTTASTPYAMYPEYSFYINDPMYGIPAPIRAGSLSLKGKYKLTTIDDQTQEVTDVKNVYFSLTDISPTAVSTCALQLCTLKNTDSSHTDLEDGDTAIADPKLVLRYNDYSSTPTLEVCTTTTNYGNVHASNFIGDLQGNATSATNLKYSSTNVLSATSTTQVTAYSNVIPDTQATNNTSNYVLGDSSHRWASAHINEINFKPYLSNASTTTNAKFTTVSGSGTDYDYSTNGISVTGDFHPSSSNLYSIGNVSKLWKSIYSCKVHAWGSSKDNGIILCDGNYESTAYSSLTGYQSGTNGQMTMHFVNATNNLEYKVVWTGPNTTTSNNETLNTIPMSSGTWNLGNNDYKLGNIYCTNLYGNFVGSGSINCLAYTDSSTGTVTPLLTATSSTSISIGSNITLGGAYEKFANVYFNNVCTNYISDSKYGENVISVNYGPANPPTNIATHDIVPAGLPSSSSTYSLGWSSRPFSTVYSNGFIGGFPYGTCSTAASTVAKTVSVSPAITSNDLKTGLIIHVVFDYDNSASNPTLNVNNTGAFPLRQRHNTVMGGTVAASWSRYDHKLLTFYGSTSSGYWCLLDNNDIASSIFANGIGGIYFLAVEVTASSGTYINRGALLSSNSSVTINSINLANPYSRTSTITLNGSSTTLAHMALDTNSPASTLSSGSFRLLSTLYVFSGTYKYAVLAVRIA